MPIATYTTESSGLNGVIPAWHILELMETPKVQKYLAKIEDHELKRSSEQPFVISPNSRSGEDVFIDNPDHREDFNRLLDVAVEKPKQGDQT